MGRVYQSPDYRNYEGTLAAASDLDIVFRSTDPTENFLPDYVQILNISGGELEVYFNDKSTEVLHIDAGKGFEEDRLKITKLNLANTSGQTITYKVYARGT